MTALQGMSQAVAATAAGRPVLLVDEAEETTDIVLAAAVATPAWVSWTVRHSSGLLCAPMTAGRADALDLPPMVTRAGRGEAFTVSVDAARGVSTGISAADRAATLRVLGDPASGPRDLVRPGHVLPVRARRGRTAAAVELCARAGLPPVAMTAALVDDDGRLSGPTGVVAVAARHHLPVVTVAELARPTLAAAAASLLDTTYGPMGVAEFHDAETGAEHVVLTAGTVGRVPLVRLHVECLASQVGARCGCSERLRDALARIAVEGGALVHLRHGAGHPPADYAVAATMLAELGHTTVRLLTDDAADVAGLRTAGVAVCGTVSVTAAPTGTKVIA